MIPRYAPSFGLRDIRAAARLADAPAGGVDEVLALLRARLGLDHIALMPSARGALRLLLLALPPPFDAGRVVVPAFTCSAVAEAVHLAGRVLLPVEHQTGGLNMTAADLSGVLRPGDIVIATHQFGYPCDIQGILAVAEAAGAVVVEDIAAALGATVEGRPVGSFGLASFGSFDPSKLLHVPPKGGFVATADAALAAAIEGQAAALLRPFGTAGKLRALLGAALLASLTRPALYRLFYWVNFRLRGRLTAEDGVLAQQPNDFYTRAFAEWQAAILLPQLRGMDEILARRSTIMRAYRAAIPANRHFDVQAAEVEQPGALIRFPLYARGEKAALHRALAARRVDTGFSFTTIIAPAEARHAWRIARAVLNLPSSTRMSEGQLRHVIATVRELGARA